MIQIAPPSHRIASAGHRVAEFGREREPRLRVQRELELGDDAEVAAASAQRPVQVRVRLGARAQRFTRRRDQFERHDVVAREAVLSGEPAHAAAEGQAADARVRHVARGRREAVCLGRVVEGAEQCSALHSCATRQRVDRHLAHRAEIDHEPIVGHGMARRCRGRRI